MSKRENPDADQPWRRFRVTLIVEEVTDGDADRDVPRASP